MSETAIKFENISKQYRLGLVSTKTLSHDLNRWWQTSVLRKEDPYLKIGETNDRASKGNSEYVWALKDINFEVNQGDVLGIIGKNGAGKSTLLKILSRVTGPTTGIIKAKGRIASLLEVGTGFHPELTGRENIYMNGSIMGMTRKEIDRKLEEIVEFAGVARYIDTPAKRYSSGMTVRLGFSIAAHLEPEILVVDEVLAVGDAEFQKKAIGKMQDVSQSEGRTVLFVSHNMASIESLCNRGIVLDQGVVYYDDLVSNSIERYRELSNKGLDIEHDFNLQKDFETVKFTDFKILSSDNREVASVFMDEYLNFQLKVQSKINANVTIRITLFDQDNVRVLAFDSSDVGEIFSLKTDEYKIIHCILNERLNIKSGIYSINISLRQGAILFDHIKTVKKIQILEKDIYGYGRFSYSDMPISLKQHSWK